MQATMIYMWMPAPAWVPALTRTLVVYFSLETVAWLVGRLDDSKWRMAIGPGDRAVVVPVAPGSAAAPANMATQPASRVGLLDQPKPARADLSLGENFVTARVSMAITAASMGYMFAAMQLMRSAM